MSRRSFTLFEFTLNGNVRGGSRAFTPSRLEIFAPNDSQLPDASDFVTKGFMADVRNFEFQLLERDSNSIDFI